MKGQKTGGRVAGTPNKVTKAVRDLVVEALHEVGGKEWLIKLAKDDPKTFCGLIGRVIPLQVDGSLDTSITFKTVYEDKR
jgi:hypothetical protein